VAKQISLVLMFLKQQIIYRKDLTYVLVIFCASRFWLHCSFSILYYVLFYSLGPNVLWDLWSMYGNETLPTIDVSYKLCPFYGLFKSKDVKL